MRRVRTHLDCMHSFVFHATCDDFNHPSPTLLSREVLFFSTRGRTEHVDLGVVTVNDFVQRAMIGEPVERPVTSSLLATLMATWRRCR